jgi:predicted aminopeptidase
MKKYYLFFSIDAGILLFFLFNFQLLNYGFNQFKGQLNVIMNAKSLDKVLLDTAFPDSLKENLILIQEIKSFAFNSLGINHSDNYSAVYDQKGEPVLWVLTATEPYNLKAKEWKFPFLGKVSYKGFFKKEDGLKEELSLKVKGFDTDLGNASGWSTLGWFKDPVLSEMLRYKKGNLANLIIHELTHGTLYVKNNVEFNENLASFIGDKGALLFLEKKFGKNSKEYEEYLTGKMDEDIFRDYVLSSAKKLDSLYKELEKETSVDIKEQKKNALFEEIASGIDELPLKDQIKYQKMKIKMLEIKNSFFMAYIRYDAKLDDFEEELNQKFNNDLKAYLSHLKSIYPSL